MGKGKAAAKKIFNFIDEGSRINPLEAENESEEKIDDSKFTGTIEFKDVWFRYPTRPSEWVFKGMNLKINNKESVALVGESGSGKSTFVGLVLRFYEPDSGSILIDGKDIKSYNV